MIKELMPIYSPDAEKWLISCLFWDNTLMYDCNISVDDFYDDRNWNIYNCMNVLMNKGKWINELNVIWEMWEENADYIREVSASSLLNTKFSDYKEQVKTDAKLRNIKAKSEKLLKMCEERNPNIESMIFDLMDLDKKDDSWKQIQECAIEFLSRIQEWELPTICPYYYWWVDAYLSGYKPWRLTIVWARPSVWKSTLLLNFCIRASLKWNRTAFFSTEMTKQEIGTRYTCNLAEVTQSSLEEWHEQSIEKASEKISKIWDIEQYCTIYDKFWEFNRMLLLIRKEAAQWVKVVYIDYLQQIPNFSSQFKLKVNIIWEMSTKLKLLAIELWIEIVCAAQLNRDWVWEPRIEHLKASWEIEQDADVVMLLHNPMWEDMPINSLKLIIWKNRWWQKWWVDLPCDLQYYKFTDHWDKFQQEEKKEEIIETESAF